ncbi:MAG: HD domain-containing protein, partial [Spirochaetales bacterium]|nr:HD domain-containing protein [Spirochaetales bacterium]
TILSFVSNGIIKQQFQKYLNSPEPDIWISGLEKKDRIMMQDIREMYNLTRNIHAIKKSKFYMYNADKQIWQELHIIDSTYIFIDTHKDDRNFLEQYVHNKMKYITGGIYYGKADINSIVIDLTRQFDKNKYVLLFSIIREDIGTVLRKNIIQFIFFDLFILLFALFLGKLFARRITNPIKHITESAASIASGDYGHQVEVERKDEIGMLAQSLNEMSTKIESSVNNIQHHIRTMETMNKIDKAVLSSISRQDLMERVVGIVTAMFLNTRIVLLLRDDENRGFTLHMYDKKTKERLLGTNPRINDTDIAGVSEEYLQMVRTVSQLRRNEKTEEFFRFMEHISGKKPGSLLCLPLHVAENYYGSLLMTKYEITGFSKEEQTTAQMLTDQVCVALQSVRMYEEKEQLLLGVMIALTKSIDAKSKWTAGHSERVAKYSEEVGILLGLNEEKLRNLTISAILHDIGKMSVPEHILDKPGQLTIEELNIIKQHPEVGAKIISDIPSYSEILPGILYHHEHWDGSGYPFRLKSENIPLDGRIISICDVYDAITYARPYRQGMAPGEAIQFIRDQKKKLFDPEIADVFLAFLSSKQGAGLN